MLAEAGGAAAIDGVAYTSGPGCRGLLVGAAVARSPRICLARGRVPGSTTWRGTCSPRYSSTTPGIPFVALLVSGGHTLLAHVHGSASTTSSGSRSTTPRVRRSTRRPKSWPRYPADRNWPRWPSRPVGYVPLPRPLTERPGLDFSFSGLNTAVVVHCAAGRLTTDARDAAGRSRTPSWTPWSSRRACARRDRLADARGRRCVGANRHLRARMLAMGERHGARVVYPRAEFCTDNAA